MGTIIQDGGMRERSDILVTVCNVMLYSNPKSKIKKIKKENKKEKQSLLSLTLTVKET